MGGNTNVRFFKHPITTLSSINQTPNNVPTTYQFPLLCLLRTLWDDLVIVIRRDYMSNSSPLGFRRLSSPILILLLIFLFQWNNQASEVVLLRHHASAWIKSDIQQESPLPALRYNNAAGIVSLPLLWAFGTSGSQTISPEPLHQAPVVRRFKISGHSSLLGSGYSEHPESEPLFFRFSFKWQYAISTVGMAGRDLLS